MDSRVRSFATLTVLGLVLALAGVWGWRALSEPLPDRSGPPVCVDRDVARGDKVTRRDVTVSVYNAGRRVGLAALTMDLLVDAGFAEGTEGNAPGKRRVERVQIWSDQPRNPAVRLVASLLGGDVDVVRRANDAPGVLVVVGDGFDDLVEGKRFIKADRAATICSPPRRAR